MSYVEKNWGQIVISHVLPVYTWLYEQSYIDNSNRVHVGASLYIIYLSPRS